jgi:hypothetical protein
MSKKVLLLVTIVSIVFLVSSCATKRDCGGRKKTYNKEGGFWM